MYLFYRKNEKKKKIHINKEDHKIFFYFNLNYRIYIIYC